MRLTRLFAAAALVASLPVVAACEKGPIGNTNNHITNGPPLPEVHPTPVPGAPSASPSTSPADGAAPSDLATESASVSSSPSVSASPSAS